MSSHIQIPKEEKDLVIDKSYPTLVLVLVGGIRYRRNSRGVPKLTWMPRDKRM